MLAPSIAKRRASPEGFCHLLHSIRITTGIFFSSRQVIAWFASTIDYDRLSPEASNTKTYTIMEHIDSWNAVAIKTPHKSSQNIAIQAGYPVVSWSRFKSLALLGKEMYHPQLQADPPITIGDMSRCKAASRCLG